MERWTSTLASRSGFRDGGFVKAKTLLALVLIGVAGFIILRVAPPYFTNAQFADKVRTEARFAQANNRTIAQVRSSVLREALQLDIPLESKDLQVEMDPSGTHITADYTVTIDLYYTRVDWEFHVDSRL